MFGGGGAYVEEHGEGVAGFEGWVLEEGVDEDGAGRGFAVWA